MSLVALDPDSHQAEPNTLVPIKEEEEDEEPLVKGEDDIPKGCWLVG